MFYLVYFLNYKTHIQSLHFHIHQIEIQEGVASIGSAAFEGCSALTSLEVPLSVKSVGKKAVDGCDSLESLTIYNPECSLYNEWIVENDNVSVYGYTGTPTENFAINNNKKFVSIGFFGKTEETIWIYTDETKVLHIIGEGNLPDYSAENIPWKDIAVFAEEVVFSDEITYIGDNSLLGCINVTEIVYPEELKDLGKNVAEDTLWFKNQGGGVVIIGSVLYSYKEGISEDNVVLSSGITTISENFSLSFRDGTLSPEGIQISNTISRISDGSLAYASSLKNLVVHMGNKYYKSVNNVLYSKDLTQLICYPAGLDGNIKIPETVTSIKPYAFAGCEKLTAITIGENVTEIAENAFADTKLRTVHGYVGSYAQTYAQENGYDFVPYTSTVTFDCNDAEGNVFETVVNTGSAIGNLFVPGQEGYVFAGWYLETDDDDVLISSDFIVNEDISLYAYWEEIPEEEPYLFEISLEVAPTKSEYFVGEELSTEGAVLLLKYSDGSIEKVTNGFYCVPSRLNYAGSQNVSVYYAGFTTNFDVNVTEVIPVSLSIPSGGLPDIVNYYVGQSINPKGLIAVVQYNNGTQRTIRDSSEFEYIYDFSEKSSASKVVLKYKEKETTVETFYHVNVENCPSVSTVEINGEPGNEISVPVYISGNPGVMGYVVYIQYDSTIMTPTVDSNGIYSGNPLTLHGGVITACVDNRAQNLPENFKKLKVIWYNSSANSLDGLLFTVGFKINSEAVVGTYDVFLDFSEEETFNEKFENVLFECSGSTLTVTESSAPIIFANDVVCNDEEYIDIPLYFDNNIGISAGTYMTIKYDDTVFDSSEIICNGVATTMFSQYDKENKTLMVFLNQVSAEVESGVLFSLRLHVKDRTKRESLIGIAINNNQWKTDGFKISIEANKDTTIIAQDAVAKAGNTISVPVSIENNSGLMGYVITVWYNENILDLTGVVAEKKWSDGIFEYSESNGCAKIIWTNSKDVSGDGNLFRLNFNVRETTTEDTEILITYEPENTYNELWENVDITCDKSNVKIVSGEVLFSEGDSGTVIDYINKYITSIRSGLESLEGFVYVNDGYVYELNKTDKKIGTGSVISVSVNDVEVDSFTIILFGDVNGDGWYDGTDSIIVSCLANGMLTKDDVSEAVYMAADCNHDGVIDSLDVALLEQAGVLLASIDQSTSSDVLATDEAYIEYLDLIHQTREVEDEEGDTTSVLEENSEVIVPNRLIDLIIAIIKSFFEMIFSLFS